MAINFYGAKTRSKVRILDLGCGTGACLWYLASEGFRTYGVDGSETAVKIAKTRMKQNRLNYSVRVADLVALPYREESFDGVIDVAAIQHNKSESIITIMKEIHRVLKPRGKLFSMLIKRGSWGYGKGRKIEPCTFTSIPAGPLAGKGKVHFFSKQEIVALLRATGFHKSGIEISSRTKNNMRRIVAYYVVSAEKD